MAALPQSPELHQLHVDLAVNCARAYEHHVLLSLLATPLSQDSQATLTQSSATNPSSGALSGGISGLVSATTVQVEEELLATWSEALTAAGG